MLVNNNLCHNVSSFSYGGWGLYNDQTTTSVMHTNNVIYDTEDACYHDHEGYNVTLANNIFVKLGSTTAPHSDGTLRSASPTNKPGQRWHAAFHMQGNIIASTGPAPLFTAGSDLQWALSTFDDNVYWVDGDNADSKLFPYESSGSEMWQTLAEWQARGVHDGKLGGQDKRSVVADPQFTNAAQHDYSLKAGSPALNLGFKQIDISTVGPRYGGLGK